MGWIAIPLNSVSDLERWSPLERQSSRDTTLAGAIYDVMSFVCGAFGTVTNQSCILFQLMVAVGRAFSTTLQLSGATTSPLQYLRNIVLVSLIRYDKRDHILPFLSPGQSSNHQVLRWVHGYPYGWLVF